MVLSFQRTWIQRQTVPFENQSYESRAIVPIPLPEAAPEAQFEVLQSLVEDLDPMVLFTGFVLIGKGLVIL
jgi:hypothetical protein